VRGAFVAGPPVEVFDKDDFAAPGELVLIMMSKVRIGQAGTVRAFQV